MVLLRTRLYRLLYFSLPSSAVSCSTVGSSRGCIVLLFICPNLSGCLDHFSEGFLICQQFGCFGNNLFPIGIRFRVCLFAVCLRLLPDLRSFLFCLFLHITTDCILLAAYPFDVLKILLRCGFCCLKDTIERQSSFCQGTSVVNRNFAIPELCFCLL